MLVCGIDQHGVAAFRAAHHEYVVFEGPNDDLVHFDATLTPMQGGRHLLSMA